MTTEIEFQATYGLFPFFQKHGFNEHMGRLRLCGSSSRNISKENPQACHEWFQVLQKLRMTPACAATFLDQNRRGAV